MPAKQNTSAKKANLPAAPGLLRLGKLLLFQPFHLRRLLEKWGFEADAKIRSYWQRRNEPQVRLFIRRSALWQFVIGPTFALAVSVALSLLGVSISSTGVIAGILSGVAFGMVIGGIESVAEGTVFGVAFGVCGGVGAGVGVGDTGDGSEGIIFFGAAFGVAVGTAFSAGASIVRGVPVVISRNITTAVTIGVVFGAGAGVILGAAVGVIVGTGISVAILISALGFYFWLGAAPTTLILRLLARVCQNTSQLSGALPHLHHDLLYLPLPGLRGFLLQLAEEDPERAETVIAYTATSVGQRRIAKSVLIELQARALEKAARDRLFARAQTLDFAFLPSPDDLEEFSSLRMFMAAAKDLAVRGNQRQRRLGLDRAQRSLAKFHGSTTAKNTGPLRRRLLPTAQLWVEVVKDEQARLEQEIKANPEVPTPFIAGPPVKPSIPDSESLFKGRDDLIDLLDHDFGPDRRGLVLVTGQRRMGKTTLRHWLDPRLGTGTRVVDIDLQSLSGAVHREAPHRMILEVIAAAFPDNPAPPDTARWAPGLAWLQELESTLGDLRLLVVIDEIERVQDGIDEGWCTADVLDFLRAAGDSLERTRFLLLTAYPLHHLGAHWVDRLISVTARTVSYLDPTSARELLEHPIPDFPKIYPPGGVERILEQTNGHPYLLQKTGDELCRLLNARKAYGRPATDSELTEVFDTMIDELNLFDELWRQRSIRERKALRALAAGMSGGDVPRSLVRGGYVRETPSPQLCVPLFARWIIECAPSEHHE